MDYDELREVRQKLAEDPANKRLMELFDDTWMAAQRCIGEAITRWRKLKDGNPEQVRQALGEMSNPVGQESGSSQIPAGLMIGHVLTLQGKTTMSDDELFNIVVSYIETFNLGLDFANILVAV